MTDETTQHSDIPPDAVPPSDGDAPPSDGAPEPAAADPTPAELLGVASVPSASTQTEDPTPAQLLDVAPDLAATLDLEEPQERGADLATELRKGAGSSDPPTGKG